MMTKLQLLQRKELGCLLCDKRLNSVNK